jgi:hypothetical protein
MFKTFIIAVKSDFVNEAFIFLDETGTNLKLLQDIGVIVGATAAISGEDALKRVSVNYELPEEILTYFEVA